MAASKFRKALTAGATAAITVIVTKVQADGAPNDGAEWVGTIAAMAAAFIVAAAATYAVRNEGPGIGPNGSEVLRRPGDGGSTFGPAV